MREKLEKLLAGLSKDDKFYHEKKKLINYFLNLLVHDLAQNQEYLIPNEDKGITTWANLNGFKLGTNKKDGWPCTLSA